MIDRIGRYSIRNGRDAKRINRKLKHFMIFVKVFFSCSVLIAICALLIVPFLGTERKLFFNIGFPLDWQHNNFAYWIAFIFILTEVFLSAISVLFSVMMWYLLLNCGLRFEVLGQDLCNMGMVAEVVDETGNKCMISKAEKENQFSKDLVAAIQTHQKIIE